MPGGSPGNAAPATPKTLEDFVAVAIAEGRDEDAYQLLRLDAIAGGKSLGGMRWFPAVRHNSPAIHFGLGIVYVGTRAVKGPEPIGGTPAAGGAGGPGGMMGPGMMPGMDGNPGGGNRGRQRNQRNNNNNFQPGGNQQPKAKPELFTAPTEPAAMLAFYTGELGDKLLQNLKKRFEKGDFGPGFKDAMKSSSKFGGAMAGMLPGAEGGAPGMMPGGPGMPGMMPGGPGMMPGGPGMPGMMPGGPGMPGMGGPGGAGGNVAPANGDQLIPGVTMLGEAKQAELLKKAAERGCDVLILFELEVAKGGQTPINTTQISLHNVQSKEMIHSGGSLVNVQVRKAREEKKGDDPVDAEMGRIFAVVDERLAAKDFPANAKPEKVATFVDKMLEQKVENPLPALAEIRFFRSKDLITSEKMVEAYGKLLGPEVGEKVAGGDAAAALESLAKWLPEKRPETIAAASGRGGQAGGDDAKPGEKKSGIFGKLFGN
jgi:hypothetical protein